MGTSTRNRGQNGHTPLVPSWLEENNDFNEMGNNKPVVVSIIPPDGDPNRFRGPRGSFTNFVNNGGIYTGGVKKAISNYVSHSLGGSKNAMRRLGSARSSTAKLHGILGVLSGGGGVSAVGKALSIDNLEGLPAKQFFISLKVV